MGYFDPDRQRYVTGVPEDTKAPLDRYRADRHEVARWVAQAGQQPAPAQTASSFTAGLDRAGRTALRDAANRYLQIGDGDPEGLDMFRRGVANDLEAAVEFGEDPDDLTLPARVVNDLGADVDMQVDHLKHERHLDQVNEDIDRWAADQFGSFEAAAEWLGSQPDANAAVDELIEAYCNEHGLDSATGYPIADESGSTSQPANVEHSDWESGASSTYAPHVDHDAAEQLTAGLPDV
jgi:hypothetical protein